MAETASGKIKDLLERAERQNDSNAPTASSVTSSARVFSSIEAAENEFVRFYKKLLHVEQWNHDSEISSFELFERNGDAGSKKIARVGDFIRITLPGSGKSDWVKIAEIDESPLEIVLTVHPSHDPTDADDAETTSHFFIRDSTNNFCLRRENSTVIFYVIGLDEKTNATETGGVLETVRNYATANLGYFFGIQKTQWKTFCDNFLEIER